MPQRGELHAVKVLNDPGSIFHYLNGDTEQFFNSENFQRKFMHEFPRLLWGTEKVEDLGDFVLLFPNPAHLSSSALSTGIKIEEAELNFQSLFDTAYTYPYKRKFMTALKEAYDMAFLELDVMHDPKKDKKADLAEKLRKIEAKLHGIPSSDPVATNPGKSPRNKPGLDADKFKRGATFTNAVKGRLLSSRHKSQSKRCIRGKESEISTDKRPN